MFMKTITVRDLRTRPKEIREALKEESEAVLTSNGKPFALVLPVSLESYEETLRVVRRARAMEALDAIHRQAERSGRDRMTLPEIDMVISATRRRRQKRVGVK